MEGAIVDIKEVAKVVLKKILTAEPKESEFKKLDLTNSQKALLQQLIVARENGTELSMTELSNLTSSTKSAISQAVGKLERKGIIKRSWAKGDRRKIMVTLTAKGNQIADIFYKNILEFIQEKLGKMEEDEIIIFMRLFEKCMAT